MTLVPDTNPPFVLTGIEWPPLHRKFTRDGECRFREVGLHVGNEGRFIHSWKTNKKAWLERGFSMRSMEGKWFAAQWLLVVSDGLALTAIGEEKLAALGAPAQPELRLQQAKVELKLPELPDDLANTLYDYQRDPARQIYRALRRGIEEWGYAGAVDLSDMGTGKAQPLCSPVLTPGGFVAMGKINVGDFVIAQDGTPARVTGVFPQGVKDVWRVTFSDGSSARCCDDHLWAVQTANHRKRNQPPQIKALKDIRGDLGNATSNKWSIPMTQPVCFDEQGPLPLDPYFLGILLGDGGLSSGTPRITTPDEEILAAVRALLPAGLHLAKCGSIDYRISSGVKTKGTEILASLGLIGAKSDTKRIPAQYLVAGIDDRHALLQGLLDTDGSPNGASAEFSTTSPKLAEGVKFLAQSLGGTARTVNRQTYYTYNGEKKPGLPSFRITVRLPVAFAPFRLRRKAEKIRTRSKYPVHRSIVKVEPDGREECQCIRIDHPSHLYLTNEFIVTHNTAQSMAAALATGRKLVVLCPSVGQAGWMKMFGIFKATPHFISTYEAVRGGWRSHVAEYDAARDRFTWHHPQDIIIILDEAQAVRHDSSLTFKCCAAAIRQGIPIIVASATVATSPLEMRFAGRITGLHQGGGDWPRFLQDHGCVQSRGGGWKWDQRRHHLQRIHSQLFPMRGARVRKTDLGERCPETVIEVLPFDIPEAAEIEREWQETLGYLDRLAAQYGEGFARSRQMAAMSKMWEKCEMTLVPHIAKRIKQDLANGKSVAVFMNFNRSRIELSKLLNTKAGFYGGQNKKMRAYYEKQFQENREFVLVSNIGAGGASVSLHDVKGERPRVAYIFPTDRVVQMEQATGRVDRIDGKSVSFQYIPCLKGAITEKMVSRTREKMLRIATINDGLGGATTRF